jgi:hypothetical protein
VKRHLPLVALALLVGCSTAGPAREAFRETPYYPLKVGTRWVYRVDDNKHLTLYVARHEKVGDEVCALVETVRDGEVIGKEHIRSTASGVYSLGRDGKRLVPPLPLLKLPPTVGQTWSVNLKRGGKVSKGTYRMGEDTVQVPLGKFQAVTLRGESFEEESGLAVAFTYWFAPGYGPVKQVVRVGGKRTAMELESFEGPE